MLTTYEVLRGTRRSTQRVVYELAKSIRERDLITYEHCRRVAVYANRLARHMGWSRRAGRDLALAGLVHDLGKTWITNSVLHKESALSSAERVEMERHPTIAARMLETYGAPAELVATVEHHHEMFNGCGYPDHLAGEAIPLGARLLTVADVFDALTSVRPYKAAMSVSAACERIGAGVGTHFDPEVAAAFLALVQAHPSFALATRVETYALPDPESPWREHDFLEE